MLSCILPLMTVDALIILAGGFVTVLPFLGFPNSWDTVLLFLVGVFIIGLGIMVRRRSESRPRRGSTFVENLPADKAGTLRDLGTHDSS